ncbi:methyltransferase domain-containing protein [Candidatus Bathyarchaeota archaeon]|nr:MAG: methyltransferase domain-containing protein [Candidatus Bathyarchaeota archaeon]
MQRRIIRKLELETFLSKVKAHPSPKPSLEQYTIPSDVAATILHIAAYTYDDLIGKTVLDLGCGTGRLAIGAAYLGAQHVVGVDIDKKAIKTAIKNSSMFNLKEKIEWATADLDAVHGKFDTVLQNPPFGVQKRGADRKFLIKALQVGKKIYSLHKSLHKEKSFMEKLKKVKVMPVSPSPFIRRLTKENGGEIKATYAMLMKIPHMFPFHTKEKHEFIVELYVINSESY